MKYFLPLIVSLAIGLNGLMAFSQSSQQKSAAPQQKVVRINPVKVDTNDPNKKAMNKFSKEKMYNVAPEQKQIKPEELQALNLFNDGSKKGKAGDYEGAVRDFTRSLDLQKNPSTYVKRGNAYLMMGNYGAAINDANEALRLNQGFLMAYFVRGVARYETSDYKGSKDDLYYYLDKDRSNAVAFNYMAALALGNQDYKGALENYNEVVRLDPQYPDIYTNRGMMRHYNQDFKGAIQDYNEALKINPNNPTAFNNRGAAYMMLKDLESAMTDFNKAISLNPKYGDAYDNRGRVKQAQGDNTGACADWQMAIANGQAGSRDLILKFCK